MTVNDTHPTVPRHLGPNDVIALFGCMVSFFFIWFFLCKLTNLFLSFPRLYIPRNEELANEQHRHVTSTCQRCHVTAPCQCRHVTTAHHPPPASRATAHGVD